MAKQFLCSIICESELQYHSLGIYRVIISVRITHSMVKCAS